MNSERLEQRKSRVQYFVDNLTTPGWIEQYLSQRGAKFANRLPNLKLEGVEPLIYFQRLTGPVRRIQDRLQNKTLPYLTKKISTIQFVPEPNQPEEEKSQQVVKRDRLNITSLDQIRLANAIINALSNTQLASWTINRSLTSSELQGQVLDFTQYALMVGEGKVPEIPAFKISLAPSEKKEELAKEVVRHHLAKAFNENSNLDLSLINRNKYRWGKDMHEVLDYLGGDCENFMQVIDSLPDAERALFFMISSANLLETLGYIDMEECTEAEFAKYIVDSVYIPEPGERDDILSALFRTAVEREESGDLDLGAIINLLCARYPYYPMIFDEILISGKYRGFGDELTAFFASNEKTSTWTNKAMDADDRNNIIPNDRNFLSPIRIRDIRKRHDRTRY